MDIYTLLCERFPHLPAEKDFSFARHTTIGCGGTATVSVCPRGTEELAALLHFLARHAIPYVLLGAGANVLPRDGEFDGVVVRFCGMQSLSCSGSQIRARAGVTGGALLRFARENGIGGLEFLTGIPMTVGGATAMNAGVRGGHIGDLIESVTGVEGGKIRRFSAQECAFGTKTSLFLSGIAVAEVMLRGTEKPREEIELTAARYRAQRAHLPSGRSMGCVFVNPPDVTAGELIERCGLKGLSLGGARVSGQHANFIINDGATSDAVAGLIAKVRAEVYRRTGILLREEIRRIP